MTSYLKLIAKQIVTNSLSLVASGAVNDGGSYTATKAVTLPSSGLVAGDLFVAVTNEVMASGVYTDPAASTSADAVVIDSFGTQSSPRARPQLTTFTEVVSPTDHSGTITFTFSDGEAGRSSVVWMIVRSATGTVGIDVTTSYTENASSNVDVTWPTVATLTPNAWLIAAVGKRDSTDISATTLGSFLNAAAASGGRGSGMWYKEIATPATDAPATISGLDEWVAVMLAVKPA